MNAEQLNQLVDLVASVGFPMVACCVLWWFTNSICKELLETLQQNNQMLKLLTGKFLDGDDEQA